MRGAHSDFLAPFVIAAVVLPGWLSGPPFSQSALSLTKTGSGQPMMERSGFRPQRGRSLHSFAHPDRGDHHDHPAAHFGAELP
jgi:hypothetical protein